MVFQTPQEGLCPNILMPRGWFWLPFRTPKPPKIDTQMGIIMKNATSKNNMTFASIFSWLRHGFGELFLCFVPVAMLLKPAKWFGKKAYETLAMATKSKVGVFEIAEKNKKNYGKSLLFWDINLGGVFEWFLGRFGRSKSMIFVLFLLFFPSKFQ